MTALITFENVHHRPESLPAEQPDILNGISLEIPAGSFVAIVGENGSGKTTLIKHINGLLLPTNGRVLVKGMDTRDEQQRRKLRSLVGMVFQNPADQIVASTVEEDVAFGLENTNLPTAEIRNRVAAQLARVGLADEARRPPHLLSGGQVQKVALAGVLVREPEILLFDEPTTMLDPHAREAFLAGLVDLNRQGLTVVIVTHHMEEAALADYVIGVKSGQVAFYGVLDLVFNDEKCLYEIGLDLPESVALANKFRDLGWNIPASVLTPKDLLTSLPSYQGSDKKVVPQTPSSQSESSDIFIRMNDVHYTYLAGTPLAKPALRGVNLDLSPRQIHAIAGTNGSGKSTLLQHLNGILRPASGKVQVGKFPLEDPETPLRDVVRQVGLVFQSPETQFFEVFVGDEIAYGPKQFGMEDLRERVRAAMNQVGLNFDSFKDRRQETLSGGEKRKVALASTLILDQPVLLFDEPTAGMDPRARDELLRLFSHLCEKGKTILIASHRLNELARIGDSLSLMQDGRVSRSGIAREVLFDPAALRDAGLAPPLAVAVSQALIEKGWPLAGTAPTTIARLSAALREVGP